ncbi:hypothetical protein COLO4_14938 [Corchorus olitorius]|uniref:F-box domain-containing protein n=1 Tax=Corchorus olitorius TaxID=93759 RepID=A0A1R3JQ46_9ROSI|nr:hypothetical protein COLO4_14938 [Corchorus olitorius]
MGKKRRIKKSNQEKQGNQNYQDDNPRNIAIARDLDVIYLINSLHDDVLIHQIIPILLQKKHQLKENDSAIIPRQSANNKDLDPNDLISRLSNNILYNIISLLPFESAVRTTFLSTHWKDLWKDVLLESVCDVTLEDAVAAITSFLDDVISKQHRQTKNWGYKFEFGHGRVLLATFGPNNSLLIDFSAGKQEFPRPFDCLLKLNLESCPHFPSGYTSNEVVSSIMSNFPFLENLTIAKWNGLRSLKLKSTRGLHRLVVLDCPQLESLCYVGCSLSSFQYRGRLVSMEFQDTSVWFEDPSIDDDHHPSVSARSNSPYRTFLLSDAMLDIKQGPPIYHSFNFEGFKSSILKSIKSVKSLTLCSWLFEALISWMIPSLSSENDSKFNFYTLKELWWIDCSMPADNVNVLLNFLKLCPYLERLYVTIDPKSYGMASTKGVSDKVNTKLGKLNHLKLLRLEGFANEKEEIFFIEQLRPLFRRRKPLIVAKYKGASTLRCLFKVRQLEKKGKYPYKFKELGSLHKRCPDHIHMKI